MAGSIGRRGAPGLREIWHPFLDAARDSVRSGTLSWTLRDLASFLGTRDIWHPWGECVERVESFVWCLASAWPGTAFWWCPSLDTRPESGVCVSSIHMSYFKRR